MNTQQAKVYAEQELSKFIGVDLSNYSHQCDFIAVFSRIVRHFHQQGFVVYNSGDYNLTLWREQHQFEGDVFTPCYVYNPRQ